MVSNEDTGVMLERALNVCVYCYPVLLAAKMLSILIILSYKTAASSINRLSEVGIGYLQVVQLAPPYLPVDPCLS